MNILKKITKSPWRVIGVVIMIAGLYATFLRFTKGLGASTNLTDEFPWGIWIGFDVLCGVGLAAGGFTLSAIVFIFHREKYKPVARPAVLTAFIGYVLVAGGLMYDLGHPWRIWHPIIMWNPHSVMFEVGWCVMLYTTVLAAETSAMVFEKLKMMRSAKIAHALTFPLSIAAVLLSMLHQSSLGSLFLIVPGRLHELWYTPFLPLLFFVSAAGIGCSMTIMESNLSARAFGRALETDVLRGLAKVAAIIIAIYLVLRLGDMVRTGALRHVLAFDRAAWFFLAEILLGFIAPMVIFGSKRLRHNNRWLYRGARLAVFGFIINRLNVGVTGFEVVANTTYIPAWTEVAVTAMLVTIGITVFYLAVKYLPVLEEDEFALQRRRQWEKERERQAQAFGLPQTALAGASEGEGA